MRIDARAQSILISLLSIASIDHIQQNTRYKTHDEIVGESRYDAINTKSLISAASDDLCIAHVQSTVRIEGVGKKAGVN